MVLTATQCETLDQFYIDEGSHLSFDGLTHPRTGIAMPRVRIEEMGEYAFLGVDRYGVVLKLEILP